MTSPALDLARRGAWYRADINQESVDLTLVLIGEVFFPVHLADLIPHIPVEVVLEDPTLDDYVTYFGDKPFIHLGDYLYELLSCFFATNRVT